MDKNILKLFVKDEYKTENFDVKPYYSFLNKNYELKGWSREMSDMLDAVSGEHFIDIYNRELVFEGVKEVFVKTPKAAYLDVGCSSGFLIQELKRAFPELQIIGADYDDTALQNAQKLLVDVPLVQFDLTNCPFKDNTFDAITCLNVLEHISDDSKAFSELNRIVKPGGRLVITVPAFQSLYDIYDEVHHHYRRYSLSDLTQKAGDAGFKVVWSNYFPFFLFPPFVLAKIWNKTIYRNLTLEEKYKIVESEATSTKSSKLFLLLSKIEKYFNLKIKFPFGIRAYLILNKTL